MDTRIEYAATVAQRHTVRKSRRNSESDSSGKLNLSWVVRRCGDRTEERAADLVSRRRELDAIEGVDEIRLEE